MSCRTSLLALASLPGGASTAELFDHFKHLSRCTVQNTLSELRSEGMLFGVRWVDDRGSSRYFTSREALDAWREANPKRMTQRERKAAAKASPKPRPASMADKLLEALQAAEFEGLTREAAALAVGTKSHDTISRITLDMAKAGQIHTERHKQRVLFFAAGYRNKARIDQWRQEVGDTVSRTAKLGAATRKAEAVKRKKFSVVTRPAGVPAPVSAASWVGPMGDEVDYSRAKVTRIDSPPNSRWQCAPDLPPDPRYPSFSSQPLGSSLVRTE